MSREANGRRMQALVTRWRKEGGSAAAFAARHGVSPAKFGYWRRRQGPHRETAVRQGKPDERVAFRPVQLIGPVAGGAVLEIALAGGERVLVHEGATTELLAAAVAAVRAAAGC